MNAVKLYIVPTFAEQLDDQHDVLGPYSDTESGQELAETVADRYRHEGVVCRVIRSATRPSKLAQGIICDILTDGRSYSNGGISATHKRVTLIGPEIEQATRQIKAAGNYPMTLHAPSADAPAVRLCTTSPNYLVAEPTEKPSGAVGPMSGGTWIVSSDRRRWEILTGSHRPIPLHDRFETTEQYRLNSD